MALIIALGKCKIPFGMKIGAFGVTGIDMFLVKILPFADFGIYFSLFEYFLICKFPCMIWNLAKVHVALNGEQVVGNQIMRPSLMMGCYLADLEMILFYLLNFYRMK